VVESYWKKMLVVESPPVLIPPSGHNLYLSSILSLDENHGSLAGSPTVRTSLLAGSALSVDLDVQP
jgi:hypothetical protein